jgi:2-methylaconitate cis-trans-isomerase PrpF
MTSSSTTEVNLPIKKVVLFKHGVSYVEREGQVVNDSQIELYFRASEMNDVLKSLTVLDLDGGIISSISYQANQRFVVFTTIIIVNLRYI